jgi:hypothetical protein
MSKITDAIDAQSIAFAQTFIEQRKAALTRKKATTTGELSDSLDFEMTKQAGEEAASLLLMFSDHGRFLDMKPQSFHYEHDQWGRNAIERLQNWIERKGVSKFMEGWLKKRGLIKTAQSYQKVLNSIAWGIALSRTKGEMRSKKWWNKSKTAGTANLQNNVVAALYEPVIETIVEELTDLQKFNAYQNTRRSYSLKNGR